ncbi:Imm1 family immunity protein [Actinosynnema sp. NPDC023587]
MFVDRVTERTFHADAVLPFNRVREALHEFRRTGERPTCVDWQPAPDQVY